jgi:hypothetical protein
MIEAAWFPRNIIELEEMFGSEANCVDYLRKLKWPEGFRCPRQGCGGQASYTLTARRLEECRCCGRQVSITAGTVFHGTRKPLRQWFRAIWLFVTSKRGLSASELSRQVGVHHETAWTWGHKLRAAVTTLYGREPLTGAVEIDETFIGGTDDRAHGGRSLAGRKALVVGAVEVRRGKNGQPVMGRARLEVAASSREEDIDPFLARNIKPGTVASTDGHAGYQNMQAKGFGHQRHIIGRDPKRAAKVLPLVHRLFSLVRRVLLGTYHGAVSHRLLPLYLGEHVFRFNRRNAQHRWLLCHRLLQAAAVFQPPTYLELIDPLSVEAS